MSILYKSFNWLNPETWTTGSGSIGMFTASGAAGEDERVNGTDPYGNTSVLWEARANGSGGGDGGWAYAGPFNINPRKMYRYSVWVRRTSSTTSGTCYFGIDQCCSSNNVKTFGGTTDTNPYFDCFGIGNLTQNVWYLLVGHIWPCSDLITNDFTNIVTGGMHPNSGRWTISGGKNAALAGCNAGDYQWLSSSTTSGHRAFLYGSTDANDRLQFFRPMVEICDGSEPSIEQLLSDGSYSTKMNSTTVSYEGASSKNQRVIATGGQLITYSGQWKIHTFTGTSTFNVVSYVGNPPYAEILVVGGGGGTGYDVGGGGGGGGVLTGYTYLTGRTYTVTVGGGGGSGQTSGTRGTTGSDSSFTTTGGVAPGVTITANGGGGGGAYNTNINGINGGCGGGGGMAVGTAGTGGTGVSGQGFAGGNGTATAYGSGGGGGAGGAGAAAIANTQVAGGAPRSVPITGRAINYGGGGYGNSDNGTVHPTGLNTSGTSLGRYGFGANGTGIPNNSPYSGEGGVVIIRYKYR